MLGIINMTQTIAKGAQHIKPALRMSSFYTGVPVGTLAALLLIQLLNKMHLGRQTMIPSTWLPATPVGGVNEVPSL